MEVSDRFFNSVKPDGFLHCCWVDEAQMYPHSRRTDWVSTAFPPET
jgi:hypothetical protein